MTRFSNVRNLALKLITKNGQTVTIHQREQQSPTSSTKPWEQDEPNSTPITALGVFLPIGSLTAPSQVEEIDTLTLKATTRILVAAKIDETSDLELNVSDRVVDAAGQEWVIHQFDKLAPNGESVLYDMEAHR